MKRTTLPGINIQYPISRLILSGEKTIETRTYKIPKKFVGVPMALIETPGPASDFKARIVAIIVFGDSFEYATSKHFYADYEKHKVNKSSPWRWRPGKKKFGWPVKVLKPLRTPVAPPSERGIRYTLSCELPSSLF